MAEIRHRPEVVRWLDNGNAVYQMVCTCGLDRLPHHSRRLAVMDRHEHLMAISTVPPAERCKQPRQHRLEPWDRCALCTGQIDLFDPAEGVA